jgi:YVTN family beta-propeller protein
MRILLVLAWSFLVGADCLADPVASAEVDEPGRIRQLMIKVNDWQSAHPYQKPDRDCDWIRGTWYTGVMAAYRATGEQRFMDQALAWARAKDFAVGYEHSGSNRLFPADTWCELALLTGDDSMIKKVVAELNTPKDNTPAATRVWYLEEGVRYADSLFGLPVLAKLSRITGDSKYLAWMESFFFDVAYEIWDPEDHFFYRDKRFIGQRTANNKKVVWARGAGWAYAGMARTLAAISEDDIARPAYRRRCGWSLREMSNRSLLVGFLLTLCSTCWTLAQERQPVYVGARVCGSCHDGPGMGHQYSRWLLTKHARAYAVLAVPEAKKIAELSGIPQRPQESPVCLGCHATAAEAEPWERDPTFVLEDGVQCEKCHGPGSEYMDEDVMRSPDLAAKAGLRKPTKKECLNCHYVKGSHFAVHQLPQLNVEEGLKTIAHLMPEKTTLGPRRSDRPPPKPGPKYVGSAACGACHKGPEMGHQMSVWRMSSHARAYAVLATPKAFETAAKRGLSGEPQKLDACLKCHSTGHGAEASAFLPSFDISRGVGCEACHGPGSEYALEAVMRDKTAARSAGLQPVGRDTCLRCHTGTAEKPYDVEEGMKKLAHPTRPPKAAEGPRYKNPLNLALSPDGRELWVACEASNSVILIEVESRKKIAEIAVGGQPADVAFKPDGSTAYVSNRLDDSVSVVDVATRRVVRTLPVGDEPHGLLTDRTGKTLYVLNTSSDDISVYDTAAFSEIKRLSASRGPWSLALSPDGSSLLVTNTLSRFVKFRQPSVSEATMVDAERGAVDNRVALPEVNLMQGAAWHPSGEFAFVTMNRTKNLVPMTRILQGWTITNGLGVVWRDGSADQVLLDEPNLCFPDAADVAFTPDGRYALVTSSTSDRVAVVDVDKRGVLLVIQGVSLVQGRKGGISIEGQALTPRPPVLARLGCRS